METAGFVIYISLANNLAERKVGATMGKEALGSLKNLPTIMTCTPSQGPDVAMLHLMPAALAEFVKTIRAENLT